MNLPDYNFLPAPLWLITILHVVTLTLHLAAMNFMVGGVIVILFGTVKDRGNDLTVHGFVRLFPSAMAAAVTFGVAPLLFVQLVYPRQVYAASIVSGWFWLLFVVVASLGSCCLYGASFAPGGSGRRIDWCLSLALVGFAYISYVYSSVFSLAERPDLYRLMYVNTQSGLTRNPDVGSYIFRWRHLFLGAVTVGGYFVGWLGRDNRQAYHSGKGFFLGWVIAALIAVLRYR